jgi:hypothetical protein
MASEKIELVQWWCEDCKQFGQDFDTTAAQAHKRENPEHKVLADVTSMFRRQLEIQF